MEYFGKTLGEAIHKAAHRKHCYANQCKGRLQVWAAPKFWGPWVEIWSQFGVVGNGADDHQTVLYVSYETLSDAPSSFDVEIRGGDRFVSDIGPGSSRVTVTGNVATSVSIRCRSHSLGQIIAVSV